MDEVQFEIDGVQIDQDIKICESQILESQSKNRIQENQAKFITRYNVNEYKQNLALKKLNQNEIDKLREQVNNLELIRRKIKRALARENSRNFVLYKNVLSKIEHQNDDERREHIKNQRQQYQENRKYTKDFFCERFGNQSQALEHENNERLQKLKQECQKDRFDFKNLKVAKKWQDEENSTKRNLALKTNKEMFILRKDTNLKKFLNNITEINTCSSVVLPSIKKPDHLQQLKSKAANISSVTDILKDQGILDETSKLFSGKKSELMMTPKMSTYASTGRLKRNKLSSLFGGNLNLNYSNISHLDLSGKNPQFSQQGHSRSVNSCYTCCNEDVSEFPILMSAKR